MSIFYEQFKGGYSMNPVIFLLLILISKKNLSINNLNIDQNFDVKVNMIKSIKPYFRKEDQQILCKAEDILKILSIISNIKNNNYDSSITTNFKKLSVEEKREKIFKEMSRFMTGDNKAVAENLLTTKSNINKVKSNLNYLNTKVKSSDNKGKLNTLIDYIDCFKPILKEEIIGKIRKLEQIIRVIQSKNY